MLLQGPASWFPWHLARALRAEGACVARVLLCPGDRLFWRGDALSYRGRTENWASWIAARMAALGITDLVCLGDGRFWHRVAITEAERRTVRVHVLEQGYLRPGWLTLEPQGMGARSRIPRVPGKIRSLAREVPEPRDLQEPPQFTTSFAAYAAMDVAWNLANLLGRVAWPNYRSHSLDPPVLDWLGWLCKGLSAPLATARSRAVAAALGAPGPLFLFPLQLETDFQIRRDGGGTTLASTLETVISSFAANAPGDARLLIKRHPLDNGLRCWAMRVRRAAARAGLGGRCLYLPAGGLDPVLSRAAGVVTVNSTVGLTALRAGVPVKVLGSAVYDVPGMTHEGPLSAFWRVPTPPDQRLVEDYARMLAGTVQVPGGFDGTGVRVGAQGVARRILAPAPF